MIRYLFGFFLTVILSLGIGEAKAHQNIKRFFKQADAFFEDHSSEGKIDYEKIIDKPDKLSSLVNTIAKINLSKVDESTAKAFYLNAHNILVVHSIVSNYPIRSPHDVEGFFTSIKHKIAGEELTLEQIQDDKLLKKYGDLRLVFALSNGMNGSFPAPSNAYFSKTLDKQLDECAKRAVNDGYYVRVMKNSKKIVLSESMKRCKKKVNENEILNCLNKYRAEAIPASYVIDYYPEDKRLNIKK